VLGADAQGERGPAVLVHNAGGACPIDRTFQTYTKANPETGAVYVGRTSGNGSPLENLARRDASHAYNDEGFGPAQLDQSSGSYPAIRGREQQMIDQYRGQGNSATKINGISPSSPHRDFYMDGAEAEFGELA
jgi:hypothetical protein